MSTKKKLVVAIVAVAITLVLTVATLIVVLVASSQLASSSVVVEYVATEVSARVSANYTIGNVTNPLTNNGETILVFEPGMQTAGSLSTTGSITLTPQAPKIVFEYVFTNTSSSSTINIGMSTSVSANNNAVISYAYSSVKITDYTKLVTTDTYQNQYIYPNITADATKYVYFIISAVDVANDASCSGSLAFNLTLA